MIPCRCWLARRLAAEDLGRNAPDAREAVLSCGTSERKGRHGWVTVIGGGAAAARPGCSRGRACR